MAAKPSLTLLEALPAHLAEALDTLQRMLDGLGHVVVAYSGGVDSSLVAALAAEIGRAHV